MLHVLIIASKLLHDPAQSGCDASTHQLDDGEKNVDEYEIVKQIVDEPNDENVHPSKNSEDYKTKKIEGNDVKIFIENKIDILNELVDGKNNTHLLIDRAKHCKDENASETIDKSDVVNNGRDGDVIEIDIDAEEIGLVQMRKMHELVHDKERTITYAEELYKRIKSEKKLEKEELGNGTLIDINGLSESVGAFKEDGTKEIFEERKDKVVSKNTAMKDFKDENAKRKLVEKYMLGEKRKYATSQKVLIDRTDNDIAKNNVEPRVVVNENTVLNENVNNAITMKPHQERFVQNENVHCHLVHRQDGINDDSVKVDVNELDESVTGKEYNEVNEAKIEKSNENRITKRKVSGEFTYRMVQVIEDVDAKKENIEAINDNSERDITNIFSGTNYTVEKQLKRLGNTENVQSNGRKIGEDEQGNKKFNKHYENVAQISQSRSKKFDWFYGITRETEAADEDNKHIKSNNVAGQNGTTFTNDTKADQYDGIDKHRKSNGNDTIKDLNGNRVCIKEVSSEKKNIGCFCGFFFFFLSTFHKSTD